MRDLRFKQTGAFVVAQLYVCFAILAIVVGSTSAYANERLQALDDLKRHFGKPVDAELNLYNISKTLVLQATFQGDRLVKLSIEPRSVFSDRYPDWKETRSFPTISHQRYREYLRKFSKVKPIGSLLYTPQISMVTNNTAWRGSYYEQAYIDVGFVGRKSRVRVLDLNYFSPLTGKVISKTEILPGVYETTVETEEGDRSHRYLVKKEVFDSLVVDQVHSFEAAFVN